MYALHDTGALSTLDLSLSDLFMTKHFWQMVVKGLGQGVSLY